MSGGSFTFDNANVVYDKGDSSSVAIEAKYFTITNNTKVLSNAEKFYGISSKTDAGARITIDKQSEVVTNSLKGTTSSTRGQAWDIKTQTDIYIKDEGTFLNVNGDGRQTGATGGIFLVQAPASTINVLNGAELKVHSANTSGVLLMSKGDSVNLKNKAKLNITTDGQNNNYRSALRFRKEGNMKFNVEDHSEFKVEKTAGDAFAIRMYGGNNHITISGSSDFIVKNRGNGVASDPCGSADNQGILYTDGNNNSFTVKDEDSNVFIDAKYGAAIDSKKMMQKYHQMKERIL